MSLYDEVLTCSCCGLVLISPGSDLCRSCRADAEIAEAEWVEVEVWEPCE